LNLDVVRHPSMSEPDPLEELSALTAALRVHAELCALSGAAGLEPAALSSLRPPAAVEAAPPTPGVAVRAHVEPPAPASPAPHVAPSASGGERRVRLEVLSREVASCTRCELHRERTHTAFARGTGTSGLCFVGEGPGAEEDAQGIPFVGKAGQLLDRMIAAMGFDRDEVYVCNVVKCRPPNNRKPQPDEMATCRPYLVEQLELLEPKVIVALGASAVEGLLGITGGITRLRGNWRLYNGRIAVMPTFHPAYLLRTPEAKREVWNDLKEVVKHLGRTLPGTPSTESS
jgi:DNA polymerase